MARIAALLDDAELDLLRLEPSELLEAVFTGQLAEALGLDTGPRSLALVGAGTGAEAVLRAAAALPDATAAVVGVGVRPGRWMDGLGPIPAPTLLIAPRGDRSLLRASRRVRRRLGLRGSVSTLPEARIATFASAWIEDHLSPGAVRYRPSAAPCLAKRVAAGLPAALLGLGSLAPAAAASPLCETSVHDAVLEIRCDDPLGAKVHLAVEGDAILLNGAPIGDGVTVHDIDQIKVNSGAGNDTVQLDESHGILGPGLSPEDDVSRSEIELELDLGDGEDLLVHLGKVDGADIIKIGALGIDPGADGDLDIKASGAERFVLDAQGGDDDLDASGSDATGDAFPLGLKMLGGSGLDALAGGAAGDLLDGGPDDDHLRGNGDDDILIGGLGHNLLDGGAGLDTVQEEADADFTLTDDLLSIKQGDVEAKVKISKVEIGSLKAGDTNNTLDASAFSGAVTLEGLSGIDVLRPPSPPSGPIPIPYPNVSLDGGDGFDKIELKADADFTLTGDLLSIKQADMEGKVKVAGLEEAHLIGGDSPNTIDASKWELGPTTLEGLSGDDVLLGGKLGGLLDGGTGFDEFKQKADADFTLTGDLLSIKQADMESKVKVAGFETLNLVGGLGDNTIDASASKDVKVNLEGLAGDDVLLGGALDDVVSPGAGNDLADGGEGTDLLAVQGDADFKFLTDKLYGSSVDTVEDFEDLSVVGGEGNQRIDLRDWMFGSVTVDAGGGDDRVWGGGLADLLRGGGGNDTILGRDGNDVLAGEEGDDILRGEHGDDALDGGPGLDELDGGHERDTCVHGEDVKHCE